MRTDTKTGKDMIFCRGVLIRPVYGKDGCVVDLFHRPDRSRVRALRSFSFSVGFKENCMLALNIITRNMIRAIVIRRDRELKGSQALFCIDPID